MMACPHANSEYLTIHMLLGENNLSRYLSFSYRNFAVLVFVVAFALFSAEGGRGWLLFSGSWKAEIK
jgi:hypothetical protein